VSVCGSSGASPRNGLPEQRPYRYRGKGYDTLTARMSVEELAAEHLGTVPPVPLPAEPLHLEPEEDPEPDLFPAAPEPGPVPVPWVREDLFVPGSVPAASPPSRVIHAGRDLVCRSCGGRIPRGDLYRRDLLPTGPRGKLRPAQFHETCPAEATPAQVHAQEPETQAPEDAHPAPVPAAAPARCSECQYLVTTIGHQVACGDDS
jgi:hypothetical protein